MATYLLKWDPTKWDWHNIAELAQAVNMGVPVSKPWSCGMARRITAGDRVFLIRQGREPRGMVASGHVTRGSYEAPHLEAQDSGRSKKGAMFVDIRFDVLTEPRREALLPRSRLNESIFSSFVWDIQASGVQIPDNISGELEKVWFVRAHPEEATKQREAEERREREEKELAKREAAAQRAAEAKAKEDAKAAEQAQREEEARLAKETRQRKEAEREAQRRAEEEERKRLADEKRAAEQERARAKEAEQARAEKVRAEQAQAPQQAHAKAGAQTSASAPSAPQAAPASGALSMTASGPWSMKECAAITEDYFLMLQAETIGKLYSKADHRNRLSKELNRPAETIDDYYRGISAILGALGMPFIDTYKPAALDDAQLEAATRTFIEENPDRIESLWVEDAAQVSIPVELDDSKAFWVAAPSPAGLQGLANLNWSPVIDTEVDFRKREARNYNLAMAGERFVLAYERARLREAGGKDMLDNIEWTSQNHGTDPGYDVKSFNEKGEDRFISVKTTNFGPRFPFALSVDEIAFSRQYPGQFALYRVFNFAKGAKLFMLEGKLEDRLSLNPVVYRATL
ncbi:MAG TPA: DUF3883 domain-containing protein [Gammaproteobacteria bacterium]|nr:DUF3883 domain-containing protein [Gammaproteobacteria bacterium]